MNLHPYIIVYTEYINKLTIHLSITDTNTVFYKSLTLSTAYCVSRGCIVRAPTRTFMSI